MTVVNQAIETPHDRVFIQELTRELIKAKAAMDDTLYRELPSVSYESFSIVPYSHIDEYKGSAPTLSAPRLT
jgi:hypothetical protein